MVVAADMKAEADSPASRVQVRVRVGSILDESIFELILCLEGCLSRAIDWVGVKRLDVESGLRSPSKIPEGTLESGVTDEGSAWSRAESSSSSQGESDLELWTDEVVESVLVVGILKSNR